MNVFLYCALESVLYLELQVFDQRSTIENSGGGNKDRKWEAGLTRKEAQCGNLSVRDAADIKDKHDGLRSIWSKRW